MPIDVRIHDNTNTIKVKPNSNSTVNVSSGCEAESARIEALLKEKQNRGYIVLDDYLLDSIIFGHLPKDVLNLLTSYLINKVSYEDNIYYLLEETRDSLIYLCSKPNLSLNKIELDREGNFRVLSCPIDHSTLIKLDYLSSGHTGFAGIEFGTTAYWNSKPDYIPVEGMIVVYTDYAKDEEGRDVPNFKIGDGNAQLIDKPFVGEDLREIVEDHIHNLDIHITPQERQFWNNKLNYNEPINDLLEFTRN